MFWTQRLFNLCWLVEMIFKRETEKPYTPYAPMAIRIHIYNYIFVLFIAENLYPPVRIVSVISALAVSPRSCYKGFPPFQEVW